MSLPDLKSPHIKLRPSSPGVQLPSVVQLNIGGHVYSTTVGTLRKIPNSKLYEMFSGPSKPKTDAEGRYFIDRDGTYFGLILEYLRTQAVPTRHVQEVRREAVFYELKPLVKVLDETPQLFGEAVGRQQFLSRVPNYQENLEIIIRVARAEAIAARYSTIMVCVLRSEEDLSRYRDAMSSLNTEKESVVTFGPWKAPASVEDLLDCIKMDIEAKGYRVSFEPHNTDKGFLFKSYDYFYKLNFKWW
ncbi:BTB/POZ domain-containing protein KCTD14 [Sardina pilchardus]|uniref:BTB/POZ domain-containing protein KCTD14 n=1 Tax=Sardina pilchardus TaxID=27697 RepID=UPI002E0E9577